MAIPDFITKGLFEKAFQIYFNNQSVRILEYKNKWAIPPGDNFTSDLLRSNVTYQIGENGNKETISVVIKIFPETRIGLVDTLKEMKLFQKEIETYTKILPEIDKILGIRGAVSAQCLYAEEYPVPLLILEDLTPLGYKMLDRRQGLNLEHCLFVMKKIAQLHAASFIMYNRHPTAFSNYNEAMFSGHPFIVNWLNVGIERTINSCMERPGMEQYIPKLEQLKNNIFEKLREEIKPKPGAFNVLNHGDCWTNNIMFLYDSNGKLVDLKLIDYQLGVYSGPGVDLQYFWNTSPDMSMRLHHHLDTILNYYYDQLVATLVKLEYPTEKHPLKQQIYNDFCTKAHYGFAAGMTSLPIFRSDAREDCSLEELLKPLDVYEGSLLEHVYTNTIYWDHLEHVLPFLDKLGIFD